MSENTTIDTKGWTLSLNKEPNVSDWVCYLFGSDPNSGWGYIYRPSKENVPNWFWRQMQYICFGCRWIYKPLDK